MRDREGNKRASDSCRVGCSEEAVLYILDVYKHICIYVLLFLDFHTHVNAWVYIDIQIHHVMCYRDVSSTLDGWS